MKSAGHSQADIPRYLAWNVNDSFSFSSSKYRPRLSKTLLVGDRYGAARRSVQETSEANVE